MNDASTPLVAEEPAPEHLPDAPKVTVLLVLVEGANHDAAVAVVRRQVYEPAPRLVIVGDDPDGTPQGAEVMATLEEGIAAAGPEVDYIWILHSDARPRPDALRALVAEVERNEAALGGSKLLIAGTGDQLESIGSATDVFGEPYSGLDAGEIDLQQYDVVREVAFVRSASMLVRRDLAQGLKGLDRLLPPVAAGLDFSQRARLAGGRVISVPSSEVYHQGHCNEGGTGWREQAGRIRAMLTAYSPLTLAWVVPYDLLVSVADSIANLLLLRWRPTVRYALAWAWNLYHFPSTINQRRRFRSVRASGDEELFRFQSRGSVRLREIGSELSGRALSVFDDDQALARGTRRLRASPGIWGAALASLILLGGVRSLVFTGMPNTGLSFPFEPPTVALQRWFGSWNESGLGSPAPVHPSVGLTGLVSFIWFGAPGAARTLLSIAFGLLAIVGVGRLAGRLGLRGPGRYLAGLVLLAGPGTAAAVGAGSWLALGAAALVPWSARAAFLHPRDARPSLSSAAWALLLGILLAALSPLLVVVPLLVVALWRLTRGVRSSFLLALAGLGGAVAAAPFLIGDPGWALDPARRLGLAVPGFWPVLIAVAVAPLLFVDGSVRRYGLAGAALGIGGLGLAPLPFGGPGVEEGALVLASLGTAMVVSAALDRFGRDPARLVALLAAGVMLVLSLGVVGNGRLGLPTGDLNERLGFATALADEDGPGRILLVSTVRTDIPGEARAGPGFWYRLVDGTGTTSDEVWLPAPLAGDTTLEQALARIASGSELRPGELLSPYAVDWVVLMGPAFRLDDVLSAQLDLVPTPLDPEARVYENPLAVPIAGEGWERSGTGFILDRSQQRVTLAANYDGGWRPHPERVEWSVSVGTAEGHAWFVGSTLNITFAGVTAALLLGSLVAVGIGGRRR